MKKESLNDKYRVRSRSRTSSDRTLKREKKSVDSLDSKKYRSNNNIQKSK